MRITKLIAASALVAASAGFVGFVGPKAVAQSDANLRVGHFSPDAPAVDIYVDGRKTFAQVKFPGMSAYTPVAPGDHTVEVRAAGAAATDQPLISVTQKLDASASYLVAAVGPASALEGKLIQDDLTPPAAGKARIRLVHAAVGGQAVDAIVAGTTPLFTNVAFGTAAPYVEVDAQKYDLSIRPTGQSSQLVGKSVSLKDGGVYTIVATGDAATGVALKGFADVAPGATTSAPALDPNAATSAAEPTAESTTIAPAPAPTATEATTVTPAPTPTEATVAPPASTEVPIPDPAPPVDGGSSGSGSDPNSNPGVPVDSTGNGTGNGTDPGSAATTVVPVGQPETGFGGMSDSQSAVALLLMGSAVAGFAVLGVRRRTR